MVPFLAKPSLIPVCVEIHICSELGNRTLHIMLLLFIHEAASQIGQPALEGKRRELIWFCIPHVQLGAFQGIPATCFKWTASPF